MTFEFWQMTSDIFKWQMTNDRISRPDQSLIPFLPTTTLIIRQTAKYAWRNKPVERRKRPHAHNSDHALYGSLPLQLSSYEDDDERDRLSRRRIIYSGTWWHQEWHSSSYSGIGPTHCRRDCEEEKTNWGENTQLYRGTGGSSTYTTLQIHRGRSNRLLTIWKACRWSHYQSTAFRSTHHRKQTQTSTQTCV